MTASLLGTLISPLLKTYSQNVIEMIYLSSSKNTILNSYYYEMHPRN